MTIDSFVAQPRSRRAIEQRAVAYLQAYFPTHLTAPNILDVERLIDRVVSQSHGVSLDLVEKHDSPDTEAYFDPEEMLIVFTESEWDAVCQGQARSRFTACHEVYHVIDHLEQLQNVDVEFLETQIRLARTKPPKFRDPEWQAEHGAGALLMPAKTVVPLVRGLRVEGVGDEYVMEAIEEKYGVSKAAARARLNALRKDYAL